MVLRCCPLGLFCFGCPNHNVSLLKNVENSMLEKAENPLYTIDVRPDLPHFWPRVSRDSVVSRPPWPPFIGNTDEFSRLGSPWFCRGRMTHASLLLAVVADVNLYISNHFELYVCLCEQGLVLLWVQIFFKGVSWANVIAEERQRKCMYGIFRPCWLHIRCSRALLAVFQGISSSQVADPARHYEDGTSVREGLTT